MGPLKYIVRLLPNKVRLAIEIESALRPFEPAPLPDLKVFVTDSFRESNESPARAIARMKRAVDEAVRRFVAERHLAPSAPSTEVIILDTVEDDVLDVHTTFSEHRLLIARFHLTSGNSTALDQTYDASDGTVFGGMHAKPPVVSIPVASVSARHARVNIQGQSAILVDLGSRHGTRVRGQKLADEPSVLAEGDEILLGGARLRFIGIRRSS